MLYMYVLIENKYGLLFDLPKKNGNKIYLYQKQLMTSLQLTYIRQKLY